MPPKAARALVPHQQCCMPRYMGARIGERSMISRKLRWGIAAALLVSAGLKVSAMYQADNQSILISRNAAGSVATFSTTGSFDFNNPFFKSIGTNGRSCVTCHLPDQAWGISAEDVQRRFKNSKGTDPIF